MKNQLKIFFNFILFLKKVYGLFNTNNEDLTIFLEKLKEIKPLNFIKIENKWKEIDFTYNNNFKCCENKCINTNKTIGKCTKGNGYVNLINDGNVNYISCGEGKGVNNTFFILAENSFKKPQNCRNLSLFYFEIKCIKIERKINEMVIGLKMDGGDNKYIRFGPHTASICNEEDKMFKLPIFCWNNKDVFGCGLIYPPEGVPYVFFTQNGKQIGKAVLLKYSSDSYQPYILLKCCSVETNFGEDLETKHFVYDITKHLVSEYY
ncbi:unnamed protein product [Meloidogyne enterolobii]|uniref:Uncharacterized protein n=1 Tax=Meloidogyne enterolobii TaxID=390850 RepID=A0ACB0XLF2_MELEN